MNSSLRFHGEQLPLPWFPYLGFVFTVRCVNMLAISSHVSFHYSDNTQVLSSDLQTDAIDNHRSFHDKHGFTGKRELEPEDEARPGERTLISGPTGQWGVWGSCHC